MYFIPLKVKASILCVSDMLDPSLGPRLSFTSPQGTSSGQFCPSVAGRPGLSLRLASLEWTCCFLTCCPLIALWTLVRSDHLVYLISFDPERSCYPHYIHALYMRPREVKHLCFIRGHIAGLHETRTPAFVTHLQAWAPRTGPHDFCI